tara:strand:+ start:732 stop:1811 length:1080 start_codon:yes stop_codon:yes gene_type:complete
MKELDLLVENYFTPALGATDILRLVEQMIDEVSFSAFNFPYEGNEETSGAGSRTQYASMQGEKYPVSVETLFIVPDGDPIVLTLGSEIEFLSPWKLFKGNRLDLRGRSGKSTFAVAKFEEMEGYINIRHVEKPPGNTQGRVSAGSSAQDLVYNKIEEIGASKGIEVDKISSARPGSTKPDIVVDYGGKEVQFEVKNRNSDRGFITLFDKSMRRGKTDPDIVKHVMDAYANSVEGLPAPFTFENMIDYYKNKKDSRYGYCSDGLPVPKSGKIPNISFSSIGEDALRELRNEMIEHFKHSGDNYFSVYSASSGKVDIYYTGLGDNILQMPEIPKITNAFLGSYGGCSSGATRVGFKIRFDY